MNPHEPEAKPGKISPDAGEPERGAPDVGETTAPGETTLDGDEPFPPDPERSSDRGAPASFDPRSGAVHGSGSGAGGSADAGEDYDSDGKGGGGDVDGVGGPQPIDEQNGQ